MSEVVLWRIAAETRSYSANDLSGKGAAAAPGRWNAAGETVVYAAPTISLAVVETAAHVRSGGLPLNRFIVRIAVPHEAWLEAISYDETSLNDVMPAWSAVPAGLASQEIGSHWFKDGTRLLLRVPSVIVPDEQCVLINAAHPAISTVKAETVRKFTYDSLFR